MRGKDRAVNRASRRAAGRVSTGATPAAADSSAGNGGSFYRVDVFPSDAPLSGHIGLLPGLDLAELKLMLRSPVDVLMAVSHVLLATMTAGLPREDSLSLACHVLSLANKMRILFSEDEVKYLRQVMYPLALVAVPVTGANGKKNPRKADSYESVDTNVCSPSTTSSDCNSSSFTNAYIRPIAMSPSKTIIENFTERLAVDRNAMPSIQASKRSAFHNLSPSTPTSKLDTNEAIHFDSRSLKERNEWMEYPCASGIPSTSRKPLIISSQGPQSYFKEAGLQLNKGGGPMQLTKSKRRKSRKWTPEEDDSVRQLVEKFGAGNWVNISKALYSKTPKQIHARWRDYLRPELDPDLPWTEEETVRLARYHHKMGNAWAELARLFPHRSANSIKNKVNAAKRRRRAPGDQGSGEDKLWDYLHTQAVK